jgi:hypothetical protein
VFLRINGVLHYLWRAVDQHGVVLDILVQDRRNGSAAKRFFKRLLAGLKYKPRRLLTDGLKSHGMAQRELLPEVRHRSSRYHDNRAGNSHRPTRRQERQMQRFKSVGQSALPKVYVLTGDKGYDCNRFRQALMDRGIESCIPSRRSRKQLILYDKRLYRQRRRIENMFRCCRTIRARLASRRPSTYGSRSFAGLARGGTVTRDGTRAAQTILFRAARKPSRSDFVVEPVTVHITVSGGCGRAIDLRLDDTACSSIAAGPMW